MNTAALHKLGYGVYVVCSLLGGRYNGQIANTLFQVTSDPLTVAVSLNRNNLTWEYVNKSRLFSASVLRQDTPFVFIGRFGFKSGRDIDKFDGVAYKVGDTGVPVILDNAVAYLEARVSQQLEVGTHTIFVAEVVNADVISDEACLTYAYYHQVKRGRTPRAAATYLPPERKGQSATDGTA
ncbi:MAG: flavin reductase family protein [Chloroflexota bacterium]